MDVQLLVPLLFSSLVIFPASNLCSHRSESSCQYLLYFGSSVFKKNHALWKQDNLISSFLICIPLVSFSCLTALEKSSRHIWHEKVVGVDIVVWFQILIEMFSTSPISVILDILSLFGWDVFLLYLVKGPFYFYMKGYAIFYNFPAFMEIAIMLLSLILLPWYAMFIMLQMWNHLGITRIHPTW